MLVLDNWFVRRQQASRLPRTCIAQLGSIVGKKLSSFCGIYWMYQAGSARCYLERNGSKYIFLPYLKRDDLKLLTLFISNGPYTQTISCFINNASKIIRIWINPNHEGFEIPQIITEKYPFSDYRIKKYFVKSVSRQFLEHQFSLFCMFNQS